MGQRWRGEVAVTGATGFLGSHIALELRRLGWGVRGVVRNPARGQWLHGYGVELAAADLSEPDALRAAFDGADAIVANAALGSFQGELEDYIRVNVQGTEHVLRAAHAAGVRRVIMISTVAVYRTRLLRVMDEDAEPYGPRRRLFNISDFTTDWRYALSKSRAEILAHQLANELGLHITYLRPGPIYGERDPKLTTRYMRAVQRRVSAQPTVGIPQVYAGDVALATAAALERPISIHRAYNITAPPTSPYETVSLLAELLDLPTRVVPIPVPARVEYDINEALHHLGWSPRPLREGLVETLSRW